MMRLVFLACILAVTLAAGPPGPEITIVSEKNNVEFDGTYSYSFKNSDGTEAEQEGQLKQIGDQAGQTARGSSSYTSPEGEHVQLTYVADENGYQPQGSHLPVAPPIPEEIVRALNYLATAPPPKN